MVPSVFAGARHPVDLRQLQIIYCDVKKYTNVFNIYLLCYMGIHQL